MSAKPGHAWDGHEWVFSHTEEIPTTLPDGCTIDLLFDVLYCECGARYSRYRGVDAP